MKMSSEACGQVIFKIYAHTYKLDQIDIQTVYIYTDTNVFLAIMCFHH